MSSRNPVVPTLELISPSLPGRLIELESDALRIGREPGSDLWLDLKQVSWNHARIVRRAEGEFFVEDLESYNSTALDGVRLRPRTPTPLKDGSRIKICDVTLIYRLQAVEVDEENAVGATIVGSLEDMSSLGIATRSSERAAEVLRAVLEINRVLGGTTELNEVLGRAIRELFAIFAQAECGFILTREADGKLNPRATLHREGAAMSLTLSRTVIDHVLREGRALLIADVKDDSRFRSTESLNCAGIRTAMCVPVTSRDGIPIGIIQLDSRVQIASFRQEDLELLAAVSVPIGVVIENHRLLREKAALAAASEIQAALLPKRRPVVTGYSFWERYQPALEVGGDYYDYIPVDDGQASAGPARGGGERWGVAVGDVAGKGMPAALLMANLSAEVRHLVRSGAPADEVVARVNRHIYDADLPARFVTFVIGFLDPVGHRLTLVNAGHMPPLLRRSDGSVEELGGDESGLPLGINREETYRATETTLDPGDVVILYTDGVSEALSRSDTLLGIDGLRRAAASADREPARVGDAILRALRSHVGTRPQSDDIALVCFGRD